MHRVPGSAYGQHRRRNPANCEAPQRWCIQLGFGSWEDSDVSPVGFVGSPIHNASESLVQRPATTRWTALSGQRNSNNSEAGRRARPDLNVAWHQLRAESTGGVRMRGRVAMAVKDVEAGAR